MRINVTALNEIVNTNRRSVQQQAQKYQSQIETLNRISTDAGICDSKESDITIPAYNNAGDEVTRSNVITTSAKTKSEDIAYWCKGTDENGTPKVAHSTIVTCISNGEIYITSNTFGYADEPLSVRMNPNDENKKKDIHIIHLKNECFY